MHTFICRSFALFIGLCAIIHALAIPVAHDNTLALHQEVGSGDSIYAGIERRGPKGADKKTPAAPGSKKTPTNPKPPTSSKPPTSPKQTPVATSVAPIQFKYLKPEDKAVDVCNTDLECTSEDEPQNGPGSLKPKPSKPGEPARSEKLVARAPPTTYSGKPGDARHYKVNFKPDALYLASKPYWTGPDLYNQATTNLQNLKTVYATFKTQSLKALDTYKVQATSTKPRGTDIFVTEHILELQTIKKFIESVTQTEDAENPKLIKLRKAVDDKWFTDHWNKKYPAIQTRPDPVRYSHPRNDKDESINDIVFEALGSQTNADDFVLCERAINSAKGKLWSNQQPFDEKRVKRWFKLAASGYTDNSDPMSVIRTVLAVYDYMKLPEVKSRLENEIKNVKTELSMEKMKHIVGANNLPKDKAKKETVDLAQMWEEYMKRHILRFERKGVDWLKIQLQEALRLYQAELPELEDTEKKLAKETSKADKDRRATEMQKLQRDARALERDLSRAELDTAAAEDKFLKLKEQVDKIAADKREAERQRIGFWTQSNVKKAKHAEWFNLRIEYGRLQRKATSLDEKQLPKLIKQFREDVQQLESLEKLVKKMDGDVGAEEAALDLGNISLGN